ncbi:E3 ubiquitin/ISG15 ligase TRIM25-like [Rana temporaria]|uniref:E3 ubiquitin/ISG15 ligase TRIM25-like n=1 Tax=Rana temporaria TaxID=8407 RepID=UPI001AAD0DFB|nr:E3 ubiquitin/ISG15 ligase TRIM25-like [Rana temporaria]
MASAARRTELECPVCLKIYTDPVNLRCGHNFCRVCIDLVLNTQEGTGGYSCPKCREIFRKRPPLHRNKKLRNTVENFLSARPAQEDSGVSCTYCVGPTVPAVRSCLHCEVSLCDKHLRVHKKSPKHILCDPTLSMESRKCSVHKKILEYYCTEDDSCICVSCSLTEEHRGHQVEKLAKASEKKKETLRNVLQKLQTKKVETEERVKSLQEYRTKVEEKVAADTDSVTALFRDLRKRLDNLERGMLRRISRQAEYASLCIWDLEIKKGDLYRTIGHIEELCNMTDPLTVLQESDTGELYDTKDRDNQDRERHERFLHDGGCLDVAGVLHSSLTDIIRDINVYFYIKEPTAISLDVNTTDNCLELSDDRKTISITNIDQERPETPERFKRCPQALSSQSFSTGRHYWEVDFGGTDGWVVGMCYPSIDKKGELAKIGHNNKSWALYRNGNQYMAMYDNKGVLLPANIPNYRVRIYLDYEAGQISFYDLCDPITHLHTFITTFTEPLHVGLGTWEDSLKICGGNPKM